MPLNNADILPIRIKIKGPCH